MIPRGPSSLERCFPRAIPLSSRHGQTRVPDITASAVLLSYNCAEFIEEAVRGVLAQDYSPLEIVISDDASRDDTWSRIERQVATYDGHHRLILKRRRRTSGSKSAHLATLFPSLSGEVLVLFDGDDVSVSDRVRKIVAAFRLGPGVQAVYSEMNLIDRAGRSLRRSPVPRPKPGSDAATWFARVDAYAAGGTLAVRRSVIDSFGPLDPEINEDIVLPFRASLLGDVHFIDEPLVTARRHSGSLTVKPGRFDSMARYRSALLDGIEKAKQSAALRLADIDSAQRSVSDRAARFDELRSIVAKSLGEAELTAGLASSSLAVRMSTWMRLLKAGAYREHLAENAVLVLSPRLYLGFKRYRSALRIR